MCKTAEQIEMPFGLWARVGARKHALHVDTHWPNVANEIDPSMCGWLNGAAAARPYVKLS